MKTRRLFLIAACWGCLVGAASAETVTPVPKTDKEDLEVFFTNLKPGTVIEVDLENGGHVKGQFRTFDDYYDRIWVLPPDAEGAFREKSVRLASIHSVQVVADTLPEKANPQDPKSRKARKKSASAIDQDSIDRASQYQLIKP